MVVRSRPGGLGGQGLTGSGGPQLWVNRRVHALCQGQAVGRCRVTRRAEVATRAGTAINFARIVAVVARARATPAMVAAVRVRLNAMTASTSQAALAVNFPEGRWARAEFLRSVPCV